MAGIDIIFWTELYIVVGFLVTLLLLRLDIVGGWKAVIHVFLWPLTLLLLGLLEFLAYVADIPQRR